MLGEVMGILAASDDAKRLAYKETLFAQSEAQTGTFSGLGNAIISLLFRKPVYLRLRRRCSIRQGR